MFCFILSLISSVFLTLRDSGRIRFASGLRGPAGEAFSLHVMVFHGFGFGCGFYWLQYWPACKKSHADATPQKHSKRKVFLKPLMDSTDNTPQGRGQQHHFAKINHHFATAGSRPAAASFAEGERTHFFARAKIAGEVLHVGKPERAGNLRDRPAGLQQQPGDFIRPRAADFL